MKIEEFQSIPALTYRNYLKDPEKVIFNFPISKHAITNETLFEKSRQIASYLKSRYQKGDRIMLMFPTGHEFVYSLFGVLTAGMIAVPTYTPKRNNLSERVDLIMNDAGAKVLITTKKIAVYLGKNFDSFLNQEVTDVCIWEDIDLSRSDVFQLPVASTDVAFLQYTSGSTGQPKGVIVSHGNLSSNLQDLFLGARQSESTIMVSWLPFFHDLGLISSIFLPVYGNYICHIIPPVEFINSPLKWINMLSDFRATHTVAPNFAYDLCIRNYDAEKLKAIDLSCVEYMGNCAEPVRAKSIIDFFNIYKNYQLKEVLSPGYGLAEATLKVSAVPVTSSGITFMLNDGVNYLELSPADIEDCVNLENVFVGCGVSVTDTEIAIVNPSTREVIPDGSIGEIWVAGSTVAKGYWNDVVTTNAIFRASLARDPDKAYLRTGDLGFLVNQELFVSGRIKDLIIIKGANFYPQDIEYTLENVHSAIKKGAVAAFSVTRSGEEKLILVAEIERNYLPVLNVEEVFHVINAVISRSHHLEVFSIVLVKPSGIPKTSSGKIKRSDCKKQYLAGELPEIASWTPGANKINAFSSGDNLLIDEGECLVTTAVIGTIKSVLKTNVFSVEDSVYQLGVDSITSAKIVHELEVILNIKIPVTLIFSSESLFDFIQALKSIQANTWAESQIILRDDKVDEPVDDASTELNVTTEYAINGMSEKDIDEFLKSINV